MPGFLKTAVIGIMLALLLSGCWDLKDPQDLNYFTAIGFDYRDNQYYAYAQMIDFSAVAKTEGGKTETPVPVWLGKGVGVTAASALDNLYETSQFLVFYGHINAIVYSENMMKQGLDTILDLQNRYYEIRYTPWVFGTNMPMEVILTQSSFFNLSPAASILHMPKANYNQRSIIKPMMAREFISDYREPGKTAFMPLLAINSEQWRKDQEKTTMLDLKGIFLFHGGQYQGILSQEQIMGQRWTEQETRRSELLIQSDGKPVAILSLENPRVQTKPVITKDGVEFVMTIKLTGDVIELIHPLPELTMEQLASEHIKAEVRDTFEHGLKIHADILQLEHTLYRKETPYWKQHHEDKPLSLTPDSLKIEVTVDLDTAGKLKLYE